MSYKSYKIKKERFFVCVSAIFNNVRQYIVGINTNDSTDITKWTYKLSDQPSYRANHDNFCFPDSDHARAIMKEWFNHLPVKEPRLERISIQAIEKVTTIKDIRL